MPVFAYEALDVTDRRISGTLIASTPAEGRQSLREQGLAIQSFVPALRAPWTHYLRGYLRYRSRDAVAELARYLSLLLRAGIPLTESLEVLSRQAPPRIATVLKEVRDRVQGGESFADALAAFPAYFDGLFISAARMGEISGNLDESLADLAEHLRVDQSLRGELAGALIYPCLLGVIGLGVMLFLMSYVVPQLLTVLEVAGRPLPTSTLFLKRISDLLVSHWHILSVAAAIAVVGTLLLIRQRPVRRAVQSLLLRTPVVASLIRKSIIVQFAQRVTLLLRCGVPFVEAVRNVAQQSGNLVFVEELQAMAAAVESGRDIADTMARSRVFPPVVAHLVAVGQDSGELTSMLDELRHRYESEVRLAMKRFTSVLEPILIVFLAVLIGFVVFACLMPIWETTRGIL